MANVSLQNPDRRNFLRTVPVAAAATLALADASMFSSIAAAQDGVPAPTGPYTLFTAKQVQDIIKDEGPKGNKFLWNTKDFDFSLTTETATVAPEYEWHEYRDHIVYILEGTTSMEVGGKPVGTHKLRPGEWLAPKIENAETFTLNKGDIFIVPRGTPHRRSTHGTVTLLLLAPRGPVPAV